MNPIPIFISLLVFLAAFGTMYLLSEINLTTSSYGIRRNTNEGEYFNRRYYNWFLEKETELEELHRQELSQHMQLGFDQFCYSVYHGDYKIQYEIDVVQYTFWLYDAIVAFLLERDIMYNVRKFYSFRTDLYKL